MTDHPIIKSASRASRTKLAAAARLMIRSICFLLPPVFTWLKLRDLSASDILKLVSDASAGDVVWKAALIVYFFAWVWGTLWDVGLQERVYLEAPNKGKMPWQAVAIAIAISILAAVLVWADTFVQFVAALALFTTVDHAAWRYLVSFLRPMIELAREEYRRLDDEIGLEQLKLVEHQICGTWKWWRAIAGVIGIFVMLALALEMPPESSLRAGPVDLPWGFVQAVSILLWVLLMEISLWYVRIVAKVGVDTLENLREKYRLAPRARGSSGNSPSAR